MFAVMASCDLAIGEASLYCDSFQLLVWLVRMEVFVLLFFVDGLVVKGCDGCWTLWRDFVWRWRQSEL